MYHAVRNFKQFTHFKCCSPSQHTHCQRSSFQSYLALLQWVLSLRHLSSLRSNNCCKLCKYCLVPRCLSFLRDKSAQRTMGPSRFKLVTSRTCFALALTSSKSLRRGQVQVDVVLCAVCVVSSVNKVKSLKSNSMMEIVQMCRLKNVSWVLQKLRILVHVLYFGGTDVVNKTSQKRPTLVLPILLPNRKQHQEWPMVKTHCHSRSCNTSFLSSFVTLLSSHCQKHQAEVRLQWKKLLAIALRSLKRRQIYGTGVLTRLLNLCVRGLLSLGSLFL